MKKASADRITDVVFDYVFKEMCAVVPREGMTREDWNQVKQELSRKILEVAEAEGL